MNRSPTFVRVIVAAALLTTLDVAFADGAAIALRGNDRGAPACVTCHGTQGEGMPAAGFPRLAKLNAAYVRSQLNAFANGQRENPVMTPIAKALNPDERDAVARYYATLRGAAAVSGTVPNASTAGARLANQGRWSQGLPACSQCHGAMGAGVGATFPALAGQSAVYLENQLNAWQKGTRAPGPLGLMHVVASKLADADIKDVAAYFSALPVSEGSKISKP